MAGAIIVGAVDALSLKSTDFDYLVDRIRNHFAAGEEALRDEIFSPIDRGGMSFLSLPDQSGDAVRAFVTATRAAYEIERETLTPARAALWTELLQALFAYAGKQQAPE